MSQLPLLLQAPAAACPLTSGGSHRDLGAGGSCTQPVCLALSLVLGSFSCLILTMGDDILISQKDLGSLSCQSSCSYSLSMGPDLRPRAAWAAMCCLSPLWWPESPPPVHSTLPPPPPPPPPLSSAPVPISPGLAPDPWSCVKGASSKGPVFFLEAGPICTKVTKRQDSKDSNDPLADSMPLVQIVLYVSPRGVPTVSREVGITFPVKGFWWWGSDFSGVTGPPVCPSEFRVVPRFV